MQIYTVREKLLFEEAVEYAKLCRERYEYVNNV